MHSMLVVVMNTLLFAHKKLMIPTESHFPIEYDADVVLNCKSRPYILRQIKKKLKEKIETAQRLKHNAMQVLTS